MASDISSLLIASVGAAFIRFGWAPGPKVVSYLAIGVLASVLFVVFGLIFGIYRGRYRACSFDELRHLGYSTILTAAILSAGTLLVSEGVVPLSSPSVTCLLGLCVMVSTRVLVRSYRERQGYPFAAEPVIMFGCGEAGGQLVRAMSRDSNSPYRAVAFLDDAPNKRNLRLEGVPVRGTREALGEVARALDSRILIVSIATADSDLLNDLARRCEEADVRMLVVPPVSQLVHQRVQLRDIRDVDTADLLGRVPVQIDNSAILGLIKDQRVLITGAGGSIGSEICRQVARFAPAQLMMLDRDESALHAVKLSIFGQALLADDDLILADVRDRDRMMEVFELRRPSVVFHAAALKHLSLLENAPAEAIKTNVLGTANVVDAAIASGCSLFVNISTDKAANPISVLGYSKRITERITAAAAKDATGQYVSVRFGNVLGSRGSVLITFAEQIRRGGPVTITDPDVTRFFMTIPEAVLLVLQAAVCGHSGQVLILDMGKPIRIEAVAQQLIRSAGGGIAITYTGLNPGEKLHEDLLGEGEQQDRPSHPKIIQVECEPLTAQEIRFDLSADPDELHEQLRRTAGRW
ncbi:MAG: nucleoside-diphosphate sugar epimerase/dehydratase [Actinomycetes bacterium]